MTSNTELPPKKKGGRPRKVVRRNQFLGVKCTLIEKKAIEAKARSSALSVSEYLRTVGIGGKINKTEKVLPKEVLQMTGTLNHLAANMNQIAKKRNSYEELNALERATMQQLGIAIRQLAKDIKTYLQ